MISLWFQCPLLFLTSLSLIVVQTFWMCLGRQQKEMWTITWWCWRTRRRSYTHSPRLKQPQSVCSEAWFPADCTPSPSPHTAAVTGTKRLYRREHVSKIIVVLLKFLNHMSLQNEGNLKFYVNFYFFPLQLIIFSPKLNSPLK